MEKSLNEARDHFLVQFIDYGIFQNSASWTLLPQKKNDNQQGGDGMDDLLTSFDYCWMLDGSTKLWRVM